MKTGFDPLYQRYPSQRYPIYAHGGMVNCSSPQASAAGLEILRKGGNAIDAAVAMGFLLGVCEQQSSGIGGGGFMMVRFADTGEVVFIDFRDQSGAAACLDM